mmetsp:Transcript_424/g.851  ORF Transcript_424/g.851 Transcript_424/m.851 type:complete len:454 (-) Transcript_424:455-1816(-)
MIQIVHRPLANGFAGRPRRGIDSLPVFEHFIDLQLCQTKLRHNRMRRTVPGFGNARPLRQLKHFFEHQLVQWASRFIANTFKRSDPQGMIGHAPMLGVDSILLACLCGRRKRDLDKFVVGSLKFFVNGIGNGPHHCDMIPSGIGRSPHLTQLGIGVSSTIRFITVAFQANIQVIALGFQRSSPTTGKVSNVTGTVVGSVDAIIVRCVSKESNKIVTGIQSRRLSIIGRRAAGHTVGRRAVGGRMVVAIVLPFGRSGKHAGQFVSIMGSLHPNPAGQGGIRLGRVFGNIPPFDTQGSQGQWRIENVLANVFIHLFALGRPHLGNDVGAIEVSGFVLGLLQFSAISLGQFVGIPKGLQIVGCGAKFKSVRRVVQLHDGSCRPRFQRGGYLQDFAENNLQDPGAKNDAFPILTFDPNLQIVELRRGRLTQSHFGRLWQDVVGIARAQLVPTGHLGT